MATKKLQDNFTTHEQSKRLLELGVPADSADCYFNEWQHRNIRGSSDLNDGFFLRHPECSPCWSVGRLMEIAWICGKYHSDFIKGAFRCFILTINSGIPITDAIIAILFKKNMLDFSKLEE